MNRVFQEDASRIFKSEMSIKRHTGQYLPIVVTFDREV